MPKKLEDPDRPPDQSERITSSHGLIPYNHLPRQPAMLASPAQRHPMGPSGHSSLSQQRPSLPPLSQLCGHNQPATSSPYSDIFPSHISGQGHAASAYPPHRGMPSSAGASLQGHWSRNLLPMRSSGMEYQSVSPTADPAYPHDPRGQQYNPLKRSHETAEASAERTSQHGVSHSFPHTSEMSEYRGFPPSSSVSTASTPTTASYSTHGNTANYSSRQSNASPSPSSSRCSMIMRQQPRAARAGPDGKDRRPIDPPPVLQLVMSDFKQHSLEDVQELQSQFWVVHCRLISEQSPRRDLSTLASTTEDGSQEIRRLLLGSTVASPLTTQDDPDPETMPTHPVTTDQPQDPPSPSSRFFAASRPDTQSRTTSPTPSTFFIFADLSVRKAGEYRLEFSLMKMDATYLSTGSHIPTTHKIASSVFRVVNAKDFDQVQPSTKLVRGLIDRGAGFPLKLKKGTREGQRRKGQNDSQGGDYDSDSDED